MTLVAAMPPMVTTVAPVKSVPVMMIFAPPAPDPAEGETLVTIGANTLKKRRYISSKIIALSLVINRPWSILLERPYRAATTDPSAKGFRS